jgi:paraquat-inducible protein A
MVRRANPIAYAKSWVRLACRRSGCLQELHGSVANCQYDEGEALQTTIQHPVMVCDHCDTVYRKPELAHGALARCGRCGEVMERTQRLDAGSMLALTVAGLVTFFLANIYPIVHIEVRGARGASTLWGAIIASWQQGIGSIAVLTALTLFFFPLIELLAAVYVLWPLARHRRPRGFGDAMRILRFARDWSMPEVFMLGVFVSMVKLASMARITPGIGLWSFAALTCLVTLVTSFDHSRLWDLATESES